MLATVNQKIFDIQQVKAELMLNGEPFNWDLLEVQEGKFHILYNNRSFNAQVLESNEAEKSFLIQINKGQYWVSVKDRFDLLLEQLGMGNATAIKVNNIKAPMPGLIIDIKIAVGDTVAKGHTVMILEAMKMENVLKSPGDGRVKTIKVSLKDNVEKNQVLVEFE